MKQGENSPKTPKKEEKPVSKFSVFSIFLTFFMDNLGATIIYPIFAPLFLNPKDGLFSDPVTFSFKATLLGLFLAAFPFAQLICAPAIGVLADKVGRKKAFLITTSLTLVGFLLCAYAIQEHLIVLLFVSRIIMGASSGNLSICLSSLADISKCKKTKFNYYSWGSLVAGATFVLGPFIGGKLSDPTVNPMFSPSFPLWLGAALTAINLIFLAFAFSETLHHRKKEKLDFAEGLKNVNLAVKTKSIKGLYIIYFFYLLSWNMLFQFIPALLVSKFGTSNSVIGDISALMGLCWILGSLVLNKVFLYRVSTKSLLLFSAIAFGILVVVTSQMMSLLLFTVILGGAVVIASFGWPLCAGSISNAAHGSIQGKIAGISQSVQSLAMVIAPVVIGPFLDKHSGYPFYISAGVSALFGILVLMTPIRE